jgi:LEA14-like dessication related protein
LKLNGQRFASGETDCEVLIPANGDTTFAINVDLDLLQTSPNLLYIVRDGTRRDIAYEVEGRMGIDLPLVPALRYRNSGSIRLGAETR